MEVGEGSRSFLLSFVVVVVVVDVLFQWSRFSYHMIRPYNKIANSTGFWIRWGWILIALLFCVSEPLASCLISQVLTVFIGKVGMISYEEDDVWIHIRSCDGSVSMPGPGTQYTFTDSLCVCVVKTGLFRDRGRDWISRKCWKQRRLSLFGVESEWEGGGWKITKPGHEEKCTQPVTTALLRRPQGVNDEGLAASRYGLKRGKSYSECCCPVIHGKNLFLIECLSK